ncbi:MAG: toll/interleukin-1 receptor domain-containing protein, partial [Casimicrobiaceae bacterium]|nr:toll/interleukin-1 receptor domain-containing protein [Casimicrobiaceae bacterium]
MTDRLTPLNAPEAVELLRRVSALPQVSGADRARLQAVMDAVGELDELPCDYAQVLERFASVAPRPAQPANAFTKFRGRIAKLTEGTDLAVELRVSGNKKEGLAALRFEIWGRREAAGVLRPVPAVGYAAADYQQPSAELPSQAIFISSAEKDAELVYEFTERLRTTLRGEAEERLRALAESIYYHREHLNQNRQEGAIRRAIDACKVGILLFSPNYIASDFIRKHELPRFRPSAFE